MSDRWVGFCPQCGLVAGCDEDGLCVMCGATATGPGADAVLRLVRAAVDIGDEYVNVRWKPNTPEWHFVQALAALKATGGEG